MTGKRSFCDTGSSGRQKKLAYEYTDRTGTVQSHASVVTSEVYQKFNEGDSISIVYSSKHPEISAPKYLIDQCRKALNRGWSGSAFQRVLQLLAGGLPDFTAR